MTNKKFGVGRSIKVVGNIFDNPQLKKKYGKDWEEEHK